MWVLERADARIEPGVVRCPDSDTTGVPVQWTLHLGEAVQVSADPAVATAVVITGMDERLVSRSGGDQLVVVGGHGRTRVGDPTSTWVRTLSLNDVLVLEGEDADELRLAPDEGASWTVVHLRAVAAPLPWIP